ncbi:MAG TPA: glycoside hydrolase family 2 [Candidatus Borkfalkia stercoripullorum]|nr:glycoside hydrolase family 2 [Candidatus Borkfalkia stercoripullorum]
MNHVKCYMKGYPRPQLVRGDWTDLNGAWRFGFGEETKECDALGGKLPREIRVPFSYETQMSGIGDATPRKTVWYAREIEGKEGKRTILHFEGADYETYVYVNGTLAGTHRGAYARFSVDVTKFLKTGKNMLAVRCDDADHPAQVRGKQRWEKESFGCWYVQTTGIWKSVWLEYVDDVYLESLKITPNLKDYTVRFDFGVSAPGDDVAVRFDIGFRGVKLHSVAAAANNRHNSVTVSLPSEKLTYQVELWTPCNPALYDLDIAVSKGGQETDRVGSYFALRDYSVKGDKILLNGRPFYARLLLDQGYWKESGLTPPGEEALVKDIELAKAMNFNGVRKHQKVEDERFFYYADVMGFTVWCELPSNHWYADGCSEQIAREWLEIVRANYNHPSLVTWVVFNESWGVRNILTNEAQSNLATGLYYLTKSIDTMRPVISNDGWEHAMSDILTLHDYEQDGAKLRARYETLKKISEGSSENEQPMPFADGYAYRGQPIMISEFGGTAYVCDETRGWGYGNGVGGDEEFLDRFASLVGAIDSLNISGFCYTQLSDVQQEVNGLLYEDRTPKVPLEKIAKRNRR